MHQEIRQGLEDYLGEGAASELPAHVQSHLGECSACNDELQSLRAQAKLLRSLRAPRDAEPRPGFYARVLERIEAQPASIWSVFLEPRFGFRLAVASAALAALLGAYLVVSEPSGPELASSPAVALTNTPGTQAAGNRAPQASSDDGAWQQQQRDAVLVNLASYRQ